MPIRRRRRIHIPPNQGYRLGAEQESIAGIVFPFLAFVVGIPVIAWLASKS